MLYSEIVAVCSEIHTKHTNTLYGQNVSLFNVKPGGKHSDHCTLKRLSKWQMLMFQQSCSVPPFKPDIQARLHVPQKFCPSCSQLQVYLQLLGLYHTLLNRSCICEKWVGQASIMQSATSSTSHFHRLISCNFACKDVELTSNTTLPMWLKC
jgi:hypothetical protein